MIGASLQGMYIPYSIWYEFLSTRETDARLMESKFYAARKGSWFADYSLGFMRPIRDDDFDIELTPEERKKLAARLDSLQLAARGERVVAHGWYDTQSTSTTYDWNWS
jgi:hypothetical protein